jgi:DNA-binding response OmpR family regulator
MAEKQMILLVDSNQGSLEQLAQYLEHEGYGTIRAVSLAELDQVLQSDSKFDLALIDLSGFDQSIWDRCEQLGASKRPFMVISPQRSPMVQQDSVKHGARGVLVKPIGVKELLEYVRTLLAK